VNAEDAEVTQSAQRKNQEKFLCIPSASSA
jgi:hypothetical protein